MTDLAQTNLNSKKLARNIRHRLADMLGQQWTGALDAAMDEMLLDEIEKFSIIKISAYATEPETPFREGFGDDVACTDTGNDDEPAWPLRDRKKT